MKLTNLNLCARITTDTVYLREDYGVFCDATLVKQLENHYKREVNELLIVEGSNCEPVLMVEWRWWLSEDDQFDLIRIDCTPEEWDILYSLGVL